LLFVSIDAFALYIKKALKKNVTAKTPSMIFICLVLI
jgi:hypothetical protein